MRGGNEGRGELDRVWGFEAIRSSQDGSSLGDLVGNGEDRKMGKVAEKGHIPAGQYHILLSVGLDQTFRYSDGAGRCLKVTFFYFLKETSQERQVNPMLFEGVNEDHRVYGHDLPF
jgi:hypothetical protein